VLLVDDEEALVRLMSRYLEKAGCEVDACGSAREAWAKFSREGVRYALAVVDLLLPDGPGDALAARLMESDLALRVVLCSGLPAGESPGGRCEYLQKPFLPRALIEKVERALVRPASLDGAPQP
jgi:DNA-binding NtrC family response regulator